MKTRNLVMLTVVFLIIGFNAMSQSISISDVAHNADASSVLDVYSTSKGMLTPRLTSAQRTGIATPATGLLVFDTTLGTFQYYDGSAWIELSYGSYWSRSGSDTYLTNTGDNLAIGATSAGIYKFYLTDPNPFVARIDGQLELWNGAGGLMLADINDFAVNNGVIQVYDNGNARIRLLANGQSYLNGGRVGVGLTNPLSRLHVRDANNIPQLNIENNQPGNASERFMAPGRDFSEGIAWDFQNGVANNFKICDFNTLTLPGIYSDPNTMVEIHTENAKTGITDINHQSRGRVFQMGMPFGLGEIIPFAIWHPVDFDMITYDEHLEWTPSAVGSSPVGGPATSFFTATEEGYYQVNSRTDFSLKDPQYEEDIHNPNYPGYVSIAIYVNGVMYSQGNKLQGADNGAMGGWNDLKNNLAPNVSDVLYLHPGDRVEIWVWQDLWWNGLRIIVGSTQTYCSVHKVS